MWSSARTWLRTVVVAACLVPLMSTAAHASPSEISAFDAVNQFIGTEMDTNQNKSNDAYGNTYPGAAVPFGMVQSSPTTYKEGDALVGEKGTTQDVPFSLSDWAASPATGETAVLTLSGRNNANGTAGTGTFRVFASEPVELAADKTVASVTLPESTDKGMMHIFDVAVS